jgi:predicted nicotinamide N-methyase
MPLEQEIDDDAKQMANQFREEHDDARYENTFVDIVPCDDLCFNDTLTQSLNNQFRTIAQSY